MIRRTRKIFSYFTLFVYSKSFRKSDDYLNVVKKAVLDLGGLYVKLIQFLCLRTALFPDEYKISFLSFYDAVPYEPMDLNEKLLQELGKHKMQRISWVSDQPFASGTFGQVYRGQLVEGTPIVIKLKRANLVSKLKIDFLLVKIVARIFDFIYYQTLIDIKKLVKDFEDVTYRELDYLAEAKNACYFHKYYKGHPSLYIPQTFPELSTANILIQEYVEGIPMTDIIRYKHETMGFGYRLWLHEQFGTDIFFILKDIAFELGIQAFTTHTFYADPHPGNIRILPNNRYAIIDFGIVGASPKNRRNYYQIIRLLSQRAEERSLESLSHEFLEWGAHKFYRYIEVLDEYYFDKSKGLAKLLVGKYTELLAMRREKMKNLEQLDRENFTKLYLEIIKTGQYLNVKIPEGMLAAMRTVVVYKSWAQFLEPDFHHMRETYHHILEAVDYNSLTNNDQDKEETITLEEALEHVLDWSAQLAEADMPLYNQIQKILKEPLHV